MGDLPSRILRSLGSSGLVACHGVCKCTLRLYGLRATSSSQAVCLPPCALVFSWLSSSPLNCSTIVSRTVFGAPHLSSPSPGFRGLSPNGPHFLWFALFKLNSTYTIADLNLARGSHPHRASHTHDRRRRKYPPCRHSHTTTNKRRK